MTNHQTLGGYQLVMNKPFLLVFACASLCVSALGAQAPAAAAGVRVAAPAPGAPVDRIVAVVGDQPLLWSDVLTAINQRRAQGLKIPDDTTAQQALAKSVLNELVDEEILVQQSKKLKLEASETEVASGADRQLKAVRAQFKSDEEYRSELRTAGFGTPEEYRRSLVDQYRRQSLQQKAFAELRKKAKPVPVTEEDVTAAFDRSKNDLQKRPALVTFRQVIVAPKPSPAAKAIALAKAETLLVQIRKGGDFEQIAKRESMDPGSRQMGGDLGWNRRGGGLVPEFERVMFALAPGQVSPVVETAFGYHIIRVDRVQSAEVKAHHILIAPVVDSTDIARARRDADTVSAMWKRGVPFDTLLAKYHDPSEEKGVLQPFVKDSLPSSYTAVMANAKAGDITAPFELANPRGPSKFGVLQVITATEPGQYQSAEVRESIRLQLSDERTIRQLLDGLRRQTYVSLRL